MSYRAMPEGSSLATYIKSAKNVLLGTNYIRFVNKWEEQIKNPCLGLYFELFE
jgi:hypothetical protein